MAACGGTNATTPSHPRLTMGNRPQQRSYIKPPADAVVTLRRFTPVSLMWQSVFVRPDRSGVLTSLIGEVGGAPQRKFRLSSSQFGRLSHLVAVARHVQHGVSGSGDYIYYLRIGREPLRSFQGKIPVQVRPLFSFLGGLMLTYCC